MKEQILTTWQINNLVNLMLLDNISDEGFECTLSKRGGRNVALQFAHLHNLRIWRLEKFAKDLLENQSRIDIKKEDVTRDLLKTRLSESAEAYIRWLEIGLENNGIIKGFKRGLIPFLGYFINHEAHHRGSIILTLKQCGHAVPNDIRAGIWAWNQI